MRRLLSICLIAFATACSTTPAVPSIPPAQAYRQAVDELIATTKVSDGYHTTSMNEDSPCRFSFQIQPGRQSTLSISFDVRTLNLNAVSEPTYGQARQIEAPKRSFACSKPSEMCTNYAGMAINFAAIASPTPQDLERAHDALRRIQAICAKGLPQ